jgi:hypothetical protein
MSGVGKRSVLLSIAASAALGAALTYIYFPKTVTVTQTVIEEKIVHKIQVVEKVRVETKKPDGTTIVVTKDRIKAENTVSELDKRISEKVTLRETPSGPKYGLSIVAGSSLRDPGSLHYGVQLEAKIMGPIWLSVFGLSDLSGGVGIGFKF